MKNLTIKKVIEGNFNGLQKYANKATEIKGENVFFYLPSLLLRNANAWAYLKGKDGEVDLYAPLNSDVFNPHDPYSNFEGNVSITFKVINSNKRVLSRAIYQDIPLDTPLYNQGYLIPKATYKRGHYFGFTARYPTLDSDATILISEKWNLQYCTINHNFAFERNLKIPVHILNSVKPHEFSVEKDFNHYFSHRITSNAEEHGHKIQMIFDPFRNYEFNELLKDKTYLDFGKQSIIFGDFPFIESILVDEDGIQTLHMQFMNSQPYFKAKGMIDYKQEQRQSIDLLLKQFNGDFDQYRDVLCSADEMSYWYKARFNLFKMPGRHFITVLEDKDIKTLEVIYPVFSVTGKKV